MGLDSYLSKEIYVGAMYDFNNVDGTIFITREGKSDSQLVCAECSGWRR